MQAPVEDLHDTGETFLIISSSFLKFAVFASAYPHDADPPGSAEIIVLTRMFFIGSVTASTRFFQKIAEDQRLHNRGNGDLKTGGCRIE